MHILVVIRQICEILRSLENMCHPLRTRAIGLPERLIEVCSRPGALQIHVYLYLYLMLVSILILYWVGEFRLEIYLSDIELLFCWHNLHFFKVGLGGWLVTYQNKYIIHTYRFYWYMSACAIGIYNFAGSRNLSYYTYKQKKPLRNETAPSRIHPQGTSVPLDSPSETWLRVWMLLMLACRMSWTICLDTASHDGEVC